VRIRQLPILLVTHCIFRKVKKTRKTTKVILNVSRLLNNDSNKLFKVAVMPEYSGPSLKDLEVESGLFDGMTFSKCKILQTKRSEYEQSL
jgi:hypothetical protein